MWITRVLLGRRWAQPPVPGSQWIGKKRKARQLTRSMMRNLRKRLGIEEENAMHLAIPYISRAEEYGQREYEEQKREEAKRRNWEQMRLEKMKPHKSIQDHFRYLSGFKKWE